MTFGVNQPGLKGSGFKHLEIRGNKRYSEYGVEYGVEYGNLRKFG